MEDSFDLSLSFTETHLAEIQAVLPKLDGSMAKSVEHAERAGHICPKAGSFVSTKSVIVGVPDPSSSGVMTPLGDTALERETLSLDPREDQSAPVTHNDVMDISDLTPGMELIGTVRNVVDYGAFVDIGVLQNGLVHLSRLSKKFVRHPREVVSVGDVVTVWVIDVDIEKKRIALTMVKDKQ